MTIDLAHQVGTYLAEGIRRREGLCVIARRQHWAVFRRQLDQMGAPLDEAARDGRLFVIEAEHALRSIVTDGGIDERAFQSVVGSALGIASQRAPLTPPRVYGEIVDILWGEGRCADALALEQLWNAYLQRRPGRLLCAYRERFDDRALDVEAICAVHADVAPVSSDIE